MSDDNRPQRNKYFYGQLLSVDDFTDEQNYFLDKCRRHNRYLHGWGVVSGLTVEEQDTGTFIVSPGLAIDCYGNEIFMDTPMEVKAPKEAGTFYVVVQYFESEVKPVPGFSDPDSGEPVQVFSRIQEECRVDISDIDPNSNHDGIGPGTIGCGRQHPLSIACLKKGREGWSVILMGRPSSASIPSKQRRLARKR